MEVEGLVVGLAVVAGDILIQGVVRHEPCRYRLDDLGSELFNRSYTYLFVSVFCGPDGQRHTPVARAAEVPVDEVFEPVAKASCTSEFGLPVDGLVEGYHPVLVCRRLDEP